jgi:hypothetical protein
MNFYLIIVPILHYFAGNIPLQSELIKYVLNIKFKFDRFFALILLFFSDENTNFLKKNELILKKNKDLNEFSISRLLSRKQSRER